MRRLPSHPALIGILPLLFSSVGCSTPPTADPTSDGPVAGASRDAVPDRPAPGQSLFDGVSLGAFEPTVFGGEGEVVVEDGRMILDYGNPLTGVTWTGDAPPRDDYRIDLVAKRLEGTDFFCGLTFPVREGHATLVLGGWGGATTGLSCIDGMDASQNETTKYLYFETGVDHAISVQVADGRVRCTVAGELLCDVPIEDHVWEVRPEVELSKPLGLCSFTTRASIGPIRLTRLAVTGG